MKIFKTLNNNVAVVLAIFFKTKNKQMKEMAHTISHFDCPIHLIKKYGGWRSREMIDFYLHLCDVLFTRYKDYVTRWLPFNEINIILHASFMGAGICFEDGENEEWIIHARPAGMLAKEAKKLANTTCK